MQSIDLSPIGLSVSEARSNQRLQLCLSVCPLLPLIILNNTYKRQSNPTLRHGIPSKFGKLEKLCYTLRSPWDDILLVGSNSDNETEVEKPVAFLNKEQKQRQLYFLIIPCALFCLVLGFAGGVLSRINQDISASHAVPVQSLEGCKDPPIRLEWRSLSRAEKKNYIEAVQCLRTTPSRLGLNQSLYDDFPWTHSRVGGNCTHLVTLSL